jgi:S1-C subfamily serine protease
VEPRAPPLIPDRAAFLQGFRLQARSGAAGTFEGAVLEALSPGSALAKAGLQVGDVLVELNGRPLDLRRLSDLVAEIEKDRAFRGQVERGGERIRFQVEFPAATR